MTPESSPFSPGQPVPIEFFIGRYSEIECLRSMVNASANGRFKIGFVSGERGIGKSSLAAFVRRLVERDDDVAGCHVFLGGVQNLSEMLNRMLHTLLNESTEKSWHKKLMDFFGDRVSKVGLFGVTLELSLSESDMLSMERNFVQSIRQMIQGLRAHKKSLFLILDDINGLAGSERFANWLKSTVDEIATSQQDMHLCILVVGLEERRQELIASQNSLARVFELIDIAPWTDDEVREFYRSSFDVGRAEVTDEGLEKLVTYTGGLPVLAHEIGDAVWRTAKSEKIEDHEISVGISIAAEVIGSKLLTPQIFSAIRSEIYRSILLKMADRPRLHFKRSEIMELLEGTEKKRLDNFLRRMTDLGALQKDAQGHGRYSFPNLLHALYFWMESQRAQHRP